MKDFPLYWIIVTLSYSLHVLIVWARNKIAVQKINPRLWYDDNNEDAVEFSVSIFKDSKVDNVTSYGKAWFEIKKKECIVITIDFKIETQEF